MENIDLNQITITESMMIRAQWKQQQRVSNYEVYMTLYVQLDFSVRIVTLLVILRSFLTNIYHIYPIMIQYLDEKLYTVQRTQTFVLNFSIKTR